LSAFAWALQVAQGAPQTFDFTLIDVGLSFEYLEHLANFVHVV
jgi:hypothetical protein